MWKKYFPKTGNPAVKMCQSFLLRCKHIVEMFFILNFFISCKRFHWRKTLTKRSDSLSILYANGQPAFLRAFSPPCFSSAPSLPFPASAYIFLSSLIPCLPLSNMFRGGHIPPGSICKLVFAFFCVFVFYIFLAHSFFLKICTVPFCVFVRF